MSDDPEQEYFSDGLAEELLNLLNRVPQLQVTPRTSAFSFKDKDFTIAEVGAQLGVSHILQGSVRRSGDTLRITAQLIDVATDSHDWSDSWQKEFEDIFVIQDEIAAHVVDALKLELLGDMPKAEQTTPEVYALVLEADFLRRQGNAPSVRRAIELLEQAIEIDPSYSPAWSQLGWSHYYGSSRGISEKDDIVPLVEDAIDKALDLNAANVDAYLLRAQVAMSYSYNLQQASTALETAEEMEPWNSAVQGSVANLSAIGGDLQKAVDHLQLAHELDPLAGWLLRGATTFYYSGRVAEALQHLQQRAKDRPFSDRAYSDWARAVLLEGDPQGALSLLDSEASDGHRAANRALVYQSMGDTGKALEELEKLLELGNRWTYEIAEVYAFMGNADEAFSWLDRAIDRRDSSLNSTVFDPFLEPIRDDPRYDEMLERLGRKRTL
jgi:TolB-like protein/Tfp pilus assembly protein PilF